MEEKDYIPGNTQLVELKKIEKELNLNYKIWAKVENSNPTGSIKARTVYNMLLNYQQKYNLSECTIIEATSGNTGIALSFYANVFKYKCVIVMPKSMSKQRRDMIAQYGAELVLVDGGMQQAKDKAVQLQKQTANSFIFDQFNQPSNYMAHFKTMEEILRDCPTVKYIFAGIGTGGTITGISKYIKEHDLSIDTIGIEPVQSPLLTKGYASSHKIQGIGANFVPSILDLKSITSIVDVDDEQSIEYAKKLRNLEQIDCGISSGAALLGAVSYLKNIDAEGKDVVIILPDKGDRYSW